MISFDYEQLFLAAQTRGHFSQTCRSTYSAARLRHNLYAWRKRKLKEAREQNLSPEHTKRLFAITIHLSESTVILEDTSHGTDRSRISVDDLSFAT